MGPTGCVLYNKKLIQTKQPFNVLKCKVKKYLKYPADMIIKKIKWEYKLNKYLKWLLKILSTCI